MKKNKAEKLIESIGVIALYEKSAKTGLKKIQKLLTENQNVFKSK